ncbi:MAG: 4Fe-4S binding protein [Armatimonadota bacterium]|nr:4Fe-4S binding protein [Armatimonadota bacterium]
MGLTSAVGICSRHPGADRVTARLGQDGALVVEGVCCTDPSLGARLRRRAPGPLVVACCSDPHCASLVEEAAERSGIPPWAFSLVLPPADTIEPPERTATRLIARARRLDAAPEVSQDSIIVRYGMHRPISTRRGLFARWTWLDREVAPRIEAGRCRAVFGCRLCADACPHGAIQFQDGRPAVQGDRCTGCGGCVGACPVEAMMHPPTDPAAIEVELHSLFQRLPRPRLVAFRCQDSRMPLPAPYVEIPLRCAVAVSAAHLLSAFLHGADGVAVVLGSGRGACQHSRASLERRHAAWQTLLCAVGIDPGRVTVVDSLDALCSFAGITDAMQSPVSEADRPRRPVGAGTLKSRVAALLEIRGPGSPVEDARAPLGLVECDRQRCTVCGVCATICPTGALQCRQTLARTTLLFDHALCVACRRCEDACPERALRVRPGINPALLAGRTHLAQDMVLRCRVCKEAMAPSRLAGAVEARMAALGGGTSRWRSPDVCPRCRLDAAIGTMTRHEEGSCRGDGAGVSPLRAHPGRGLHGLAAVRPPHHE